MARPLDALGGQGDAGPRVVGGEHEAQVVVGAQLGVDQAVLLGEGEDAAQIR